MNTPSGPGWARFHVEFPGEAGEKEWVTVWAADRSDAVTKAREWIQRRWTKDSRDGWEGPFGGMPVIRKIGEDPDPHDLGVSTDPDEINYGCVSKRGVALSVRLDADRIIEYTRSFRVDPAWALVRRVATEAGLDPERLVAVHLSYEEQEPLGCWVVTDEADAWVWPDRSASEESYEVDPGSFQRIEPYFLEKSRGLRGWLRAAKALRDARLV